MPAMSSFTSSGPKSARITTSKKCGASFCRTAKRSGSSPGSPPIRYRLLAIGRLRGGPLKERQDLYAGRIFPSVSIVELEERRQPPPTVLKVREGELLLGALPARVPL